MVKKPLLLFFFVMFIFNAEVLLGNNDDEARIIGIHYPKSYDVKIFQDKPNGILRDIFKVHLQFPSKEVLKFYDDELTKIGWTHFIEPYYSVRDREWQKYIMWPEEGDPLRFQLVAKWANKDKTRMLLLVLSYSSRNMTQEEQIDAKKPDNDVQEVVLQFMPFTILAPPSHGE